MVPLVFYRQLSGGNFYIGFEQVLSSLQLQRLKLYDKLCVEEVAHSPSDCCRQELSQEEYEIIDDSLINFDQLSSEENATLLFIAGYIARKEAIRPDENSLIPTDACEFTQLVSRRKLIIPPLELFVFTQMTYSLFCRLDIACANKVSRLFHVLLSFLSLENNFPFSLCQRLANTFFKGYVKRSSGLPSRAFPSHSERKLRKLSSL